MYKKLVFLLLIFALSEISLLSQTVDQIINLNLKARGGAEKLRNMTTIKTDARLSTSKMTSSFKTYSKYPDKFRLETMIDGEKLYTAFQKDTGWAIFPKTGEIIDLDRKKVSEAQNKLMSQYGIYRNHFIDYKEKGYKIEYVGTEKIKNDDAYVLKVIPPKEYSDKASEPFFVYVHSKSSLDFMVFFGKDYKDSKSGFSVLLRDNKGVNGVVIPHMIEVYKDTMKISYIQFFSIKINQEIKDSIFDRPEIPFTAEELINKTFEAHGGIDNLQKVNKLKIEADMSEAKFRVVQEKNPLTYYLSLPDKVRLEILKNDILGTVCFSGNTGWQIEPSKGNKMAISLNGKNYTAAKRFVDDYLSLWNKELYTYKTNDYKLGTVGYIADDDRNYYVVPVMLQDTLKTELFYYIDSENFQLSKRLKRTIGSTEWVEVVFKSNSPVDNLILPHVFEIKEGSMKTKITVNKYNLNPAFEDKIFEVPKK